jgi:hypothetical protein
VHLHVDMIPSLSKGALFLTLAVGCASAQGDASDDDLSVESSKLPALFETAQAGDAFTPLSSVAPVQVGESPCVAEPKVRITPLHTELSGSVVLSRLDMTRKLELSADGVPLALQALNLTATGKLAGTTSFTRGSVNLLFQVVGRYSSELVGAKSIQRFAPEATSRCGHGYLTRAEHRMSAMVLITVETETADSTIELGVSGTLSIGSAKAALSQTLQRGNFSISVRSLTDGLADGSGGAPPLGSFVVLRSAAGDSQGAEQGIAKALDWLAQLQQSMKAPVEATKLAPATSVQFKYYPGTPAELRTALSKAYDGVLHTRTERQNNFLAQKRWQDVESAIERKRGHEYNVLSAPVQTLAELRERMQTAIAPNGVFANYDSALGAQEDACSSAMSNSDERTDVAALVAGLAVCSTPVPPVDTRRFDVAPLNIASLTTESYRASACAANTRRPTDQELKLLVPFSHATGEQGIWTESTGTRYTWFRKGAPESFYINTSGVSLCVPTATGLL